MDNKQLELKLSQTASLYLAIMVLFGTVARPMFNDQSMLFTWIGIFNFVLASGVYMLIRQEVLIKYAAHSVVAITFVCLVPLLFVSGGIDSQFVVLMPLFPVFSCLFASLRVVVITSVISISLILFMQFYPQLFVDIDAIGLDQNKQTAKTFWLVVAICMSASFGYYYQRQSEKIKSLLHKYAYIDPLTEIANRRFIEDTLSREHARNQRGEQSYGLMMVDVDHFKNFNDDFGHDVGDQVLKQVAKFLAKKIRHTDYIGRFGGEEFLMIIPKVNVNDLVVLGNKLVADMSNQQIMYQGKLYKVTISIGAVWLEPKTTLTQQSIFSLADKALYSAKNAGRNCFYLS